MNRETLKATAKERGVRLLDELLVEAGRAAKRRQRTRAVKRALRTAGKAAVVAGAGVAAVVVGRAAARRGRK
jgi:hypothetical protein